MVLREVPFDRDADVSTEAFVRRYNADLANDLGNLVNRTVSMSQRYLDGRLPPVTDATEAADRELRATADGRGRLPRRHGPLPPRRGAGGDDGARRRRQRLRRGPGALGARQGRRDETRRPGAGRHGRGVPDRRPPARAGGAAAARAASTSSSASRRPTTSAGPAGPAWPR